MLTFPVSEPPADGTLREVAPGVHWTRVPLTLGVDFINVYVLDTGDGWTIVDSGMMTPQASATWAKLTGGPLAGRPVRRVIATHMHRDHVGYAGWLAARYDCPLWMTALEYAGAQASIAPDARELGAAALAFHRAAGWDEAAIANYRERLAGFAEGVYPLPASYRRVVDDERLLLGPLEWRAIVGRGHSPEHLSLASHAAGLLITGDQVLPGISTNVSLIATAPDADPLADWLASLAKVRNAVSDDVLVLPAHNPPFRGLHERIDELIAGYERSMERLQVALDRPQTAVGLIPAVFRRAVPLEHLWLASGATLARLNCLIGRGLARRERDADGIDWYCGT